MKTLLKTSFLVLSTFALATISYADAVRPQSANQPAPHTTAIFVSGVGAGESSSVTGLADLKIVFRDNGHGQQLFLFVK